jgi:hypothetical protein
VLLRLVHGIDGRHGTPFARGHILRRDGRLSPIGPAADPTAVAQNGLTTISTTTIATMTHS